MCIATGDYTKAREFTGYKVVIVDKYNHYYSPFTGLRYKVGQVKPLDVNNLKGKYYINDQQIEYNVGMTGYTGVIIDKNEAKSILNLFNQLYSDLFDYKIIKMTIIDDLKTAYMGRSDRKIIIGKFITAMSSK